MDFYMSDMMENILIKSIVGMRMWMMIQRKLFLILFLISLLNFVGCGYQITKADDSEEDDNDIVSSITDEKESVEVKDFNIPHSEKWQKSIDSYEKYLDKYEEYIVHAEKTEQLALRDCKKAVQASQRRHTVPGAATVHDWVAIDGFKLDDNDPFMLAYRSASKKRVEAGQTMRNHQKIHDAIMAEMVDPNGNQKNWEWVSKKQSEVQNKQEERRRNLMEREKELDAGLVPNECRWKIIKDRG